MARNVTVSDMDAGWGAALAGLTHMDGAGVEVGIFEEDGVHPHSDEGLTIAEIALRNEFGDDGVPARPFMATNYAANEQRYGRLAEKVFADVLKNGISVDQALQTLGATQASDVKYTINDWTSPANSAATIARKGKNDPLVDSGIMRDSVKFKKVKE
jgi:hypothetical protein